MYGECKQWCSSCSCLHYQRVRVMQMMSVTNTSGPRKTSGSFPTIWQVLVLKSGFLHVWCSWPLNSSHSSISSVPQGRCICFSHMWGWETSLHYCISIFPAITFVVFLSLVVHSVFTQASVLHQDKRSVYIWKVVGSGSF